MTPIERIGSTVGTPGGADPATDLPPATAERCGRCGAPIGDTWLRCARCDTSLAAPAELPAGATLDHGRYRLEQVLGRGGFGLTYAASDRRLQRRVALKELFPDSVVRHGATVVAAPGSRADFAAARARFLREARLLARFSHPGIVRIYEAFEEHGTVYLVMELLEGPTLSALAQGRVSPYCGDEVLDVVARVGAALVAVHAAGVLHRDVSPANIVLARDGRLVLIDFGIARPLDGSTGPVTRVVTPGYAPPEQYRSDVDLTPASDVYGLAATGYRLATGAVPPAAPERLAGVALAPPWRVNPAVPKRLSDALLDGLELDPGHRPHDVAALLARLGVAGDRRPARSLLAPVASSSVPPPPTAAPREEAPRPPVEAPPAPGPAGGAPPTGSPTRGADRLAPGPRPVGPHRQGRRLVLVPAGVAVVAFASSTPVVAAALVVVVGLPALATLGDVAVHQHRQAAGQVWRRWHRWPLRAVLPVRALRNVGVSVFRSTPALSFGAMVVATALLLQHAGASVVLRHAVVRAGGALLGVGLVWPARAGGAGFRCGLGLERMVDELLDRRGRYRNAGWATLLVCVAVTAAGLWFTPEVWPL